MTPYWILFIVAATGALTERARKPATSGVHAKRTGLNSKGLNASWWLIALGLTLFIGLRHEVGGDWGSYLKSFESLDLPTLLDELPWSTLLSRDIGYRVFEWIGQATTNSIYAVNLLSGLVFAYGLARFCKDLPRPLLALTCAIPYLVIVVGMGYSRQAIAIGCAMVGLTWLGRGYRWRYASWILLASLFHQSASVLLGLALVVGKRRIVFAMISALGLVALLAYAVAAETTARLASGYLASEYESEGALIRLAMGSIPALLFLLRQRHFAMHTFERSMWRWMALGQLTFLALLAVSPSSTAIDRIALYLLPLQLALFAHLPHAYARLIGKRVCALLIIAYYGAVLFTWLFFATHAGYWLPYETVLNTL